MRVEYDEQRGQRHPERGVVDGGERGSRLSLRPELVQLVKQVTAPILLTRGSPWAPSPRILVAAGFNAPDAVTRSKMLELSNRLSSDCQGWFSEPKLDPASDSNSLCEQVERTQTDILVVAAPEISRNTTTQISEFETLLSAITCDTLVVPRSSMDSSLVARFSVAFRSNAAHREPRKSAEYAE